MNKKDKNSNYYNIMEKVAEQNYKTWGFPNSDYALLHALNDNTYNYKGYYNKYPNGKSNAINHWTDEFKTVYHPTFSKESIYSGKKSQYNPKGIKGGSWLFEKFFIPSKDQLMEYFKKGGGIHIKKENRGKFTDYCGGKVTSECIAKGKNSSNPAIRKRATFAANARKWKHQQGGIMDYQTWSNMSIGDQWKYRLNRAKAHLQNPNIENVWEAGKTILGGNDPENPNMNLMTAPDILPGKINPGFSIQKVRSFKFPAITNEAEAVAAKDWILSQGFKPNPKGNPIKIKTNPNPEPVSNKVVKKEEMFKTNEKHYKQDWLEDKEYGVSKSKRKAFKTAEAMESGDARRINSGYTNLKKAQLNQVEMNLHKYPQFEQKAYEKGLKNIYRRGGDKDALKKYKREFFKKLAGQYGYFKEGGYIQQNLLPIINISDIDSAHNGWEEFSKEFLNKQKEEYLKKKLLEQQQVEQEGSLFGNFLQTGLGKVFDLIGNKKSSDTQLTQTSSTQPSSNYLSNNLNFGVKSIFGTY